MNKGNIDLSTIFQGLPESLLVLDADLRLIAATDSYFAITHTNPKDILGKLVFDVFEESRETINAKGAKNLKESLNRVLRTKKSHTMPTLRYDIKLPPEEGGKFVGRWWRITNSPILNSSGRVIYIINTVEDISRLVSVLEDAQDNIKDK